MLDKIKKKHFRNANTAIFETQFINAFFATFNKNVKFSIFFQYDISKQNKIVRLTCESIVNFIDYEKHTRKIKIFRIQMTLCARQKNQRRRLQSI